MAYSSDASFIIIMVRQGNMQADMRRSWEITSWYQQQEVNWDTVHNLSVYEPSKPASTVTNFLQQGQAYSNKTTPPSNAIPYEFMGANCIHTTTEV